MIRKSLSEQIEAVAEFCGITITELTGRSCIRRLTDARKILMLIVKEYTAITQREVADRLELSTAAVSKQTNSAIGDVATRAQVQIFLNKWIGSVYDTFFLRRPDTMLELM